ncbi:MAG: response regulator [Lachnospiraceae bacterium]|nr:response regulator [Lachnospiraceae bacterium]
MDKKVLLIGDTKGFMVNGIAGGLKREGYTVITVAPEVTEISHVTDAPRIWVLYLDSVPVAINKTLTYIKDELCEKELYFFPIGTSEEQEKIREVIPENLITKSFLRPLNVKDLAAEMDMTVMKGTQAEEKKKILIVDDDTTMLTMLRGLLSAKYHVYVANSGMNAITLLSKTDVDLILLDYEMPVLNGAKVLEALRSESATSSIPVMFLTGKNDRQSVMTAVPLHPEKYLLKSMPHEEWLANIDEFFEKKKKHP